MTRVENKDIKDFLSQFQTRTMFIAHVRELGIKGVPEDATKCLIARVLEREFGAPVCVMDGVARVAGKGSAELGPVLDDVLHRFDTGGYEDLEEKPAEDADT